MVQKVRLGVEYYMPKPRSVSGKKNLISENLMELRHRYNLSQRDLAQKLQIAGCDMDKNVITRIETQKRYVNDIEIQQLCEILNTTFEEFTKQNKPVAICIHHNNKFFPLSLFNYTL
jgi:transcriptional regulator with XRE-family HTH domain